MMPAKSGREVIPARGSPGSLFFLSKSPNRTAAGAASSAPAEKPMMPILFGSMFHSLAYARTMRMAWRASYHLVGLRVVSVAAQAIPQDDRVDSVVVEEGDEIGGLRADVQGVVAAARRQDHRRAGIEAAIDRVHFDGGVVNVDDAVDASRHGLAHVVLLGLADAVHFEKRRAGRIKRDDHAARQNGLRSIRSVGRRPRLRHCERGGKRRQFRIALRTGSGPRQCSPKQRNVQRPDSFHRDYPDLSACQNYITGASCRIVFVSLAAPDDSRTLKAAGNRMVIV